jgi:hypothetical protein
MHPGPSFFGQWKKKVTARHTDADCCAFFLKEVHFFFHRMLSKERVMNRFAGTVLQKMNKKTAANHRRLSGDEAGHYPGGNWGVLL